RGLYQEVPATTPAPAPPTRRTVPMAARPVTHPSQDVLRALASGQLDDATAETVFAHLDTCPQCCRVAATLGGDSFLPRLRAAHEPSATTPDARRQAETQGAAVPPAGSLKDVPPELRDHPQYEVLRELGRGGMGVVYLARNRLMDRTEVLKVVNQQ